MFNKWFLVLTLTTLFFNVSCKKNPTFSKNTVPTASFTISPTSGTTATTFTFDASSSSDNEDSTSTLQVRWDWETDGVWDTDYRTLKTIIHQYLQPGIYTIVLDVKDVGGLSGTTTKTVSVSQPNTVPTASFTISPTSGTIATTFTFDASSSSDNEDSTSTLQVRWDWENDGVWDTDYSTTKTATHQYTLTGTYTVKLRVKDSEELTGTTTKTVSVQQPSTVVTFPDTNFEALIRATLVKPSGDITDLDLETIIALNGGGWNISDISGIEYCTNLQTFALWSNQIVDISDLSDLLNLQVLGLEGNQIIDIYPLVQNSGIGSGDVVYLKNNPLSDTSINTYIPQLEGRGVTISHNSDNAVTFPDANFEALIRVTLSKPSGGITESDMETITVLNGGGWNISDISGIEYCTNLQTLALWSNQIVDISDLSGLTNLGWLDLSNNQVVDINPLIQNSGIGSGDTVYINGNPLNSTSNNTYIPQLEARGVTVYYDSVVMVTFPDANFEALIRVTLSKPSGDITESDMKTITALNGIGWIISDISGIEYCTNLQTLNLENNQIVDISDLSGLTNLGWLDLSNNQVVDINPLVQNGGIGSGDTVYLNNNPLSGTSINTYIPQLEARGVTVLHNSANIVTFTDANFEALIRAALSKPSDDITESDMETITTLNGIGWNISDISGIEYCTNLQTLNLEQNQITDISDLSGLTNLGWLDLSNNQVVDINPLVQNSGIGSGDTVYLNGNPLSGTSNNTYIPQLEARGVTVYYDGGTVVTFPDANFEALIRTTLGKPSGDITVLDLATITAISGGNLNISDISGIEHCTNLQTLNLEQNQIIDISDLSGLTNLGWLDLSNNQVVDINPLVQNSGINSGDTVYLNNNPLSGTSINTYIPQLEARGVTVYH